MKHKLSKLLTILSLAGAISVSHAATAPPQDEAAAQGDDADKLALMLSNPVANLMSFPLQNNWDFNLGSENATRYQLNFQPVIPFSLNDDYTLITRTIIPFIDLEEPEPGFGNHSGLGDTTQSFFLSPKKPTSGGFILGAGPVFLYPTATDDALGADQWGMGPTFVVLKQSNGWTVGILANHLWSFTGSEYNSAGFEEKSEVNATYLQPFVTYTTKTKTTFSLNTESSYDWTQDQWTVPINLAVSQLFKVGKVPFQAQIGGRYYAEGPDGGPDWGVRFTLTMLLPAS